MRDAIDFLHSGKLGKITLARGLCYKRRPSIGKVSGPQPIPKSIDYNLWCGPAPVKPLMREEPALRLALVLGLRQRRPRQPGDS